MGIKRIKNISEFLTQIKNLENEHNVFFRGHSNLEYELEPGIYRKINNKNLVEFEDQIYREIITKAPQDFVGKNTLETLALMQHYEAPTRVLDLTENALVALYFACVGNEKKDGEVIVFDIPDKSVCHYDSDRVTVLSNLAKCDKNFNFHFTLGALKQNEVDRLEYKKSTLSLTDQLELGNLQILDFLSSSSANIQAEYDASPENFEIIYSHYLERFKTANRLVTSSKEKVFRNYFIEILQNFYKGEYINDLKQCNQNYFGKLIHNIREDKSYFEAIIDPKDISSVLAIRPKLNNPRIAKQYGAFLIFGVQQTFFTEFGEYKPMASLNEDWILRGKGKTQRIIIDKRKKGDILSELNSIGLNQASLFPEVDKVSSFVKNKYISKLQ